MVVAKKQELLIIRRVKFFYTVNITGTERPNDIIEIQAYPESNDVVGLKDFTFIRHPNSTINMVKDVIASGEDISGVSLQEITTLQVIQTEYYRGNKICRILRRKCNSIKLLRPTSRILSCRFSKGSRFFQTILYLPRSTGW